MHHLEEADEGCGVFKRSHAVNVLSVMPGTGDRCVPNVAFEGKFQHRTIVWILTTYCCDSRETCGRIMC